MPPASFRFVVALLILGLCRAAFAAEPVREAPITDDDREHWAFQPLKKPAVPEVMDAGGWSHTPIDAFILRKLAGRDLAPQREAEKHVVLRRVSFDLTGLPPMPEEIAAFDGDDSPDAYERLVERLLASPRYGERWGQHWLDLARFAETDGFEHDKTRPNAWKYRDWVIGAFNSDLSYQRFVSLQLAGDELEPGDAEAGIATMFCLSGPDMSDINDQQLRRHDLLNEMTATVSATFMALQFGCAQCHDHKFDPISQADFFRLRAVLEPGVPQLQRDKLIGELKETTGEAPPALFYIRGDVRRPGPEVVAAFPRIVNERGEKIAPPADSAKSSGRRAALAAWLTRGDHPLTARVIVNRLWEHHFGRGLSTSSSDFGLMGEEPTHRELLDWLAVELVEHDWSLKHVQRLIVTSAVYRQRGDVGGDESGAPASPALYAAFPRQRLSAEAIRDALLAVSGEINWQAGGPGVMPPLPLEVEKTLLGGQWKTSADPAEHARRSIYIFARRNLRYPLLEAFDRPRADLPCPRRFQSTTALQSLHLLNSEFSLDVAKKLAGQILLSSEGKPESAIEPLFLRVYARRPAAGERAVVEKFLVEQAARIVAEKRSAEKLTMPQPPVNQLRPEEAAAFVDLCLALLNTSEFVYVD
jgi:hypothetical protein